MRIASWNVNSVRQRISHLTSWLTDTSPDIVCLQEIKCIDEAFPRSEIEALGYNVAVSGQKTFNGVAILSRLPFDEVITGLPGDGDDHQARYLEAVFSTKAGALRVASLYLPNGNPVDSEKYPYKLRWMERLHARAAELLLLEEPFVLAGDYNIIPHSEDAKNPAEWLKDALYLPQSRERFYQLIGLGLTDAFRACNNEPGHYTFWDYQAGAWQRDNGIRIDHLLLSPQAAALLQECSIDKSMRARERASDHVPVRCDLAL